MRIKKSLSILHNTLRLFSIPTLHSVSGESKWSLSKWHRAIPSLLHMWKRLALHIWKAPTARQKKVELLQIFKLLMQNSSCPTQNCIQTAMSNVKQKRKNIYICKNRVLRYFFGNSSKFPWHLEASSVHVHIKLVRFSVRRMLTDEWICCFRESTEIFSWVGVGLVGSSGEGG